jgi:hypothetical protein
MPETTSAVALTPPHLINTMHTSPITPNYQRSLNVDRKTAECISNSKIEKRVCNPIQVGADVVCVKTQQSRELRHHSGIWQFAKSDGRLRSPASLESSPTTAKAACSVYLWSKQDPIGRGGMRSAALKSEASRNADILSAAGRLPDSHDPIPSHAVDSCR